MPISSDIYYHHFQGSSLHLKPPLVLIHGAAGNHLYWPHEIRRLHGTQVYALDLPAHGKSRGQAYQAISGYAAVVYDWLRELEISEAVFAGHSMGGAIALKLAQEYPDCVAGLVLVGTGARLRIAPEIMQHAESETTHLNAVRLIVNASFSPGTPSRFIEIAANRMAEVRSSVLYVDLRACDQFDEIGKLSAIQKPTLILCGEYDQLTPPRFSRYLTEHIPNALLKILPDAGHMVQIEKPEQVAKAISEFIMGMQI